MPCPPCPLSCTLPIPTPTLPSTLRGPRCRQSPMSGAGGAAAFARFGTCLLRRRRLWPVPDEEGAEDEVEAMDCDRLELGAWLGVDDRDEDMVR